MVLINPQSGLIDDHAENAKCTNIIKNYLLNSTLHGLRYVGQSAISLFERAFFCISFIVVLVLSTYFISNIWQKWSASPVIVAFNAVPTLIDDIPFPAVTICNMNQAKRSVVNDIPDGSFEDSLLQSLCIKKMNGYTTASPLLTKSSKYVANWTVFRQFLLNVSQPCREMLVFCRYATVTEKCMRLFDTMLTDDGLCCIFNLVHPKYLIQKYNVTDEFENERNDNSFIPVDWTPENGFQTSPKKRSYPRPAAGAGSHLGLTVILNANVDDYYCSTTNSAGFKVLLHPPIETPRIADYGFTVSPGNEARAVITPKIADASPQIRNVPYIQRQCLFASEGNLTYFRTYTRKNCEMECESKILEDACDCVLYFMPRLNINTTICNRDDEICYENIKLATELYTNDTYECSCLPSCFEITYKADVTTGLLGIGQFSIRQKIIKSMKPEFVQKNIAIVHIYYEENWFRSYTKEELIGFTEFLSNTGGLLGLFLGFSMISLIELFYYITLRPYCANYKYLKTMQNDQRQNVKSKNDRMLFKRTTKIASNDDQYYKSRYALGFPSN